MRFRTWLLPLLATPLLTACINDSASYMIDGSSNAVTLIRQQRWLWDKKVDAAVVVARLPECQRRHPLGQISPQAKVELWQPGPGTYLLRQDNRLILTETQTCEGWQTLEAEPPGGLGRQIGTFQAQDGKLKFVPAPAPAAPAAQPAQ